MHLSHFTQLYLTVQKSTSMGHQLFLADHSTPYWLSTSFLYQHNYAVALCICLTSHSITLQFRCSQAWVISSSSPTSAPLTGSLEMQWIKSYIACKPSNLYWAHNIVFRCAYLLLYVDIYLCILYFMYEYLIYSEFTRTYVIIVR